jgi:transcriptional regulator with XRE-family HTH domain
MVSKASDEQTEQPEPIGSRVRRLRQERKLAQDRLAIEAHLDQSGLSKFERSNRGMGEIPLRRIAAVLRISYEDLIAGTDFHPRGARL